MSEPTFTVTASKESAESAVFVIEPLEQGYGHTLGNAIRRAMLDSLPGAAVTQVKIKGVRHQFTTLKGMSEDIVELILGLKQLRVRYEGEEPQTLRLTAQGPGEIKASQIKTPPTVSIINKDLVLGTLAEKKATLDVEMTVERGVGYSPVEERPADQLGLIPIDATYTPIRRVAYRIEATRVGRRTDLDRLILEVETDGTMKPKQALEQTAKLLGAYFKQIYEPKVLKKEKPEVEDVRMNEMFRLTVEELDLPTRIANALRKGGYKTVQDLSQATESEITQVKNLGEKSVELVMKALKKKGVSFKE
jgi:DNA-directed RNA polymerase subunit alpha